MRELLLFAWRVYEVPQAPDCGAPCVYFVGFDIQDCSAAVSDPIARYDAASRTGYNAQGHTFVLKGDPGDPSEPHPDVKQAWLDWRVHNGVEKARELTEAFAA